MAVGRPDSTGAISLQSICSVHFPIQSWVIQQDINISWSLIQHGTVLEQLIAGLEDGADALAFSSGMAAGRSIPSILPGDHIILGDDLGRWFYPYVHKYLRTKWH